MLAFNSACEFNLFELPQDIIDVIIEFTENPVFDLCIVSNYFNIHVKLLRLYNITYKQLLLWPQKFQTVKRISSLDLRFCKRINNTDVLNHHNTLTKLSLHCNEIISDITLAQLTNLTDLDLCHNSSITDKSLMTLTNLMDLGLCWNFNITDTSIKVLTNLVSINLCNNNQITDESISVLTNLRNLHISRGSTIMYGFIDAKSENYASIIFNYTRDQKL